jgi:hypothetical protein
MMAEGNERAEPGDADRLATADSTADPSTAQRDGAAYPSAAAHVGTAPGLVTTTLTDPSPPRLAYRHEQHTADLRQQLDEKAAATDELREALHELRHVLDVDRPPPATARPRGGAVLGILAILSLMIVVLVLWLFLDHDSGRIVASSPSASDTQIIGTVGDARGVGVVGEGHGTSAPTSAAPGDQDLTAGPQIRPLPWPGGPVLTPPGLASTGPGVSTPGTAVQVAVDPDGSHLDVFERLLFEAPSGEPLALTTPPLSALPALGTAAHVTDLQVQLDDQSVLPTATGPASWQVTPAAGRTYLRATFRYRLTGSVALVTPAAPGRALGLVTPLTGMVSAGRGHDVQVSSDDPKVLGVSCPTATQGAVCGSRSGRGWTATVPVDARPVIVLLQLDTRA